MVNSANKMLPKNQMPLSQRLGWREVGQRQQAKVDVGVPTASPVPAAGTA